jgi:hypothetical protein
MALWVGVCAALALHGCGSADTHAPDCAAHGSTDGLPNVQPQVLRYDNLIATLGQAPDSAAALVAFRQGFGTAKYHFVQWLFSVDSLSYDTTRTTPDSMDIALATDLYYYAKLPGFRKLRDSVATCYPPNFDFGTLLAEPLQRFAQHFPNLQPPAIRVNLENRDRRMYWQAAFELYRTHYDTTRNILSFSLDYFCRPTFPSLAPDIPKYIRRSCTPQHLAPALFHTLFRHLMPPPLVSQRPTFLDQIVNAGIRNYLVSRMMPCVPDSVILEYSAEQMEWCRTHEKQVYETMLPLLFSQSANEYEPYVNMAPFCKVFGQESPGRIAEYIGLQMVRSYVRRQPASFGLASLLTLTDSRALLEAANYKP